MRKVREYTLAVVLSAATLLPMTTYAENAPAASDVAIAVTNAQIADVAAACVGSAAAAACTTALQNLITALKAANPNASVDSVIGTIAARVAQASNAAIANPALAFNAAAAAKALTALASYADSQGLTALSTTIGAIASNVENKVSIDLAAIASGSGNAIPANPASPA